MIVESLDGSLNAVIFHFDKTEAAGAASFSVRDQFDRHNCAVGREEVVIFIERMINNFISGAMLDW